LKLDRAVGQCGRPRLQISDDLISYKSWRCTAGIPVETRPRRDALGPEFLAAPRANDQIGSLRYDLLSRHDPVSGGALGSAVGKDVDSAGDLDKLRNPSIPEISRSSHSSKKTRGCFGKHSAWLRA